MYKQTRGMVVTCDGPSHVQLQEMWRDKSYSLHGAWVARQTVQIGYEHGDLAEELPNRVSFVVQAIDDEQGTVYVTVSAVCPSVVKKGELRCALEAMGVPDAEPESAIGVLALAEYGISVPIAAWEIESPDGAIGWKARPVLRKDCDAVMRQARCVIGMQRMFIGFQLDQQVNLIGTTGWDAMRGDLMAGLFYEQGE